MNTLESTTYISEEEIYQKKNKSYILGSTFFDSFIAYDENKARYFLDNLFYHGLELQPGSGREEKINYIKNNLGQGSAYYEKIFKLIGYYFIVKSQDVPSNQRNLQDTNNDNTLISSYFFEKLKDLDTAGLEKLAKEVISIANKHFSLLVKDQNNFLNTSKIEEKSTIAAELNKSLLLHFKNNENLSKYTFLPKQISYSLYQNNGFFPTLDFSFNIHSFYDLIQNNSGFEVMTMLNYIQKMRKDVQDFYKKVSDIGLVGHKITERSLVPYFNKDTGVYTYSIRDGEKKHLQKIEDALLQSVIDAYFDKMNITGQDDSEKMQYLLSILRLMSQRDMDENLFEDDCKKRVTPEILDGVKAKIDALSSRLSNDSYIKDVLAFYMDKITNSTIFFENDKDIGFSINFRKGLDARIHLRHIYDSDFSCTFQLIENDDIAQSTLELQNSQGTTILTDSQSPEYQYAKKYLIKLMESNDLRNDIFLSETLPETQKEIFLDHCIYSLLSLPKIKKESTIKDQAHVFIKIINRFDRNITQEKKNDTLPNYPAPQKLSDEEKNISDQVFLSNFYKFLDGSTIPNIYSVSNLSPAVVDRIDDSNLSPNKISYIKFVSDSDYRDMMYNKILLQDTYTIEKEITNIQENMEKIYTAEVDYAVLDLFSNESNPEKRVHFIKDWIYLLASNMDVNKDKILTLLYNNIGFFASKKTKMDREVADLKNTKQSLLKEIDDANKEILPIKDLIKLKKGELISRGNENTYAIVRAKLAKDKENYLLENMKKLLLKKIYDVTHSNQGAILKTSIKEGKGKLISSVDENTYAIIRAKLDKKFNEEFATSAIRKELKKQVLEDIDEKNAPALAKLNILKSKLSILENQMGQNERKLKKIISNEKDIHQESVKINGFNKILESYIQIVNESDVDKLSGKMVELENGLKKIVDEFAEIEVQLENVKIQLEAAKKLQAKEIKRSIKLRDEGLLPATGTRSAEDRATSLCQKKEQARRDINRGKIFLSFDKKDLLKELLLVRGCLLTLQPESPISKINSDDVNVISGTEKKEKEFVHKNNFIHTITIFSTDCQMIQYIKDLMKKGSTSIANFSSIPAEKHIELIYHFTRTQSLVYYLQLLDKNNLLLDNATIASSMTAWYNKNKNAIVGSFKNIENQHANYFYYIFKKLGLLDVDSHKKDNLALFGQELIKNNPELAKCISDFKYAYNLYYHNKQLKELSID